MCALFAKLIVKNCQYLKILIRAHKYRFNILSYCFYFIFCYFILLQWPQEKWLGISQFSLSQTTYDSHCMNFCGFLLYTVGFQIALNIRGLSNVIEIVILCSSDYIGLLNKTDDATTVKVQVQKLYTMIINSRAAFFDILNIKVHYSSLVEHNLNVFDKQLNSKKWNGILIMLFNPTFMLRIKFYVGINCLTIQCNSFVVLLCLFL